MAPLLSHLDLSCLNRLNRDRCVWPIVCLWDLLLILAQASMTSDDSVGPRHQARVAEQRAWTQTKLEAAGSARPNEASHWSATTQDPLGLSRPISSVRDNLQLVRTDSDWRAHRRLLLPILRPRSHATCRSLSLSPLQLSAPASETTPVRARSRRRRFSLCVSFAKL